MSTHVILSLLCREVDWFSLTGVVLLLCLAPFIVFFFVMACDQYQCSITHPLLDLYNGDATLLTIWNRAPSFSWTAAKIYATWVTFQVERTRSVLMQNKSYCFSMNRNIKLSLL